MSQYEEMKLTNIPLPPSDNEAKAPVGPNRRFVKSEIYRVWEKRMLVWSFKNNALLHDLRLLLRDYRGALRVDVTFVYLKNRIINKDGSVKKGRNDATNRIKCLFDGLSKLIGVDDAQFNCSFIERQWTVSENQQQAIVNISETAINEFTGI